MAELKPCPFCGGSVSIAKAGDKGMLWWFVTRGNGEDRCRCRVFMESEDFQVHSPMEEKQLKRTNLIEAWNRRAEDANEKRLIGCGKGFKHGHFYKPWYRSYKAMMERCYLKSCGNYDRYGGKGVTVCEEWHDINKFAEWVEASGYAPGLTIDRIDSSKGYSPDNCRWATKKQQSNNRKNTIFYTYKGETKALTDWASVLGINRYTLYDRIEKRGWSVEKAFETPVGAKMDGDTE